MAPSHTLIRFPCFNSDPSIPGFQSVLLRAIVDAVNKLQKWTMQSKGRINTLLSSATTPGSRAAPAKTSKNDTGIGALVENGEVYEKGGQFVKAVYLQPNKDASNRTLRKLADKNSDQNLSWTEVPIKPDADEEEKESLAEKVFEDLRNNIG